MTDYLEVLAERKYPVFTGFHILKNLGEKLDEAIKQILVIHQPTLEPQATKLRFDLQNLGFRVLLAEVPDAEASKRLEVAGFCWSILGQASFTRTDCVVGLGGGAVTDLAGFVASTWLRGVALVQIPTTLLAMVDAAVGGKTALNTVEGKNLVGSFYSPRLVICELNFLKTLSKIDRLSGLAEIVKYGLIVEKRILNILEESGPGEFDWQALISLSLRVKTGVVNQDFRESGLREILNYGHTLGHAIEHLERYQIRHGLAVSRGLVFAAILAEVLGLAESGLADYHIGLLTRLGLPVTYPKNRFEALYEIMGRDKKTRGATRRFILLEALQKPRTIEGLERDQLEAAYHRFARG